MKLYAYALTLGLVAGVALGHIYDGGRVGPSPVLLYEDAAALIPDPTPTAYGATGRATWYAARYRDGVSFLGRTDTSPVSMADGAASWCSMARRGGIAMVWPPLRPSCTSTQRAARCGSWCVIIVMRARRVAP